MDALQRKCREMEAVLVQVQNEWKEKLYRWSGQNQELVLSGELLKEMARFAEEYSEKSDFAQVRQAAADVWLERKGILEAQARQNREQYLRFQEEYEEWRRELEEWENHKEPEPLRSEAVIKNRERLKEKQTPYQEFYKVLEFGPKLDQTACNRLEEALLYMGILDALVIGEEYKEQVLAMDEGCCDKYLFVQRQRTERSILDVLELNLSLIHI